MYDKNPLLKTLLASLEAAHAIDITVLDVSQQTTITDTMLICSGRSSRHVKAIAEQVLEQLKIAGLPALSATGLESGEWVLLDFSYFVVHVMQPEIRAFYNLEGLWQNAPSSSAC